MTAPLENRARTAIIRVEGIPGQESTVQHNLTRKCRNGTSRDEDDHATSSFASIRVPDTDSIRKRDQKRFCSFSK